MENYAAPSLKNQDLEVQGRNSAILAILYVVAMLAATVGGLAAMLTLNAPELFYAAVAVDFFLADALRRLFRI